MPKFPTHALSQCCGCPALDSWTFDTSLFFYCAAVFQSYMYMIVVVLYTLSCYDRGYTYKK